MARRWKFNPRQKRDKYGRWTSGAAGNAVKPPKNNFVKAKGSAVVNPTASPQLSRRQGYQQYKAQQAAQQKRKTRNKRIAVAVAAVAVTGATVYATKRQASKVHSVQQEFEVHYPAIGEAAKNRSRAIRKARRIDAEARMGKQSSPMDFIAKSNPAFANAVRASKSGGKKQSGFAPQTPTPTANAMASKTENIRNLATVATAASTVAATAQQVNRSVQQERREKEATLADRGIAPSQLLLSDNRPIPTFTKEIAIQQPNTFGPVQNSMPTPRDQPMKVNRRPSPEVLARVPRQGVKVVGHSRNPGVVNPTTGQTMSWAELNEVRHRAGNQAAELHVIEEQLGISPGHKQRAKQAVVKQRENELKNPFYDADYQSTPTDAAKYKAHLARLEDMPKVTVAKDSMRAAQQLRVSPPIFQGPSPEKEGPWLEKYEADLDKGVRRPRSDRRIYEAMTGTSQSAAKLVEARAFGSKGSKRGAALAAELNKQARAEEAKFKQEWKKANPGKRFPKNGSRAMMEALKMPDQWGAKGGRRQVIRDEELVAATEYRGIDRVGWDARDKNNYEQTLAFAKYSEKILGDRGYESLPQVEDRILQENLGDFVQGTPLKKQQGRRLKK